MSSIKNNFEFGNHAMGLQQWILILKIFTDNYCNNHDRILRFVSGFICKDSSFLNAKYTATITIKIMTTITTTLISL